MSAISPESTVVLQIDGLHIAHLRLVLRDWSIAISAGVTLVCDEEGSVRRIFCVCWRLSCRTLRAALACWAWRSMWMSQLTGNRFSGSSHPLQSMMNSPWKDFSFAGKSLCRL
jgi:hypothetical protein